MRRHEVGVLLGGVIFAVLVFFAWQRFESLRDRNEWAPEAKAKILSVHDFNERRNDYHAVVGEPDWWRNVKPGIISRLTVSTVIDTGEPCPDWEDVADWMERNPDKVRAIMEY